MSRRQSKRKRTKPTSSAPNRKRRNPLEPGRQAAGGPFTLRTFEVGALPLVNHILERMGLEKLLEQHLPPDDPRIELPTAQAILVLVRNVLISREPIYGVGEWAARFAPGLFDLWEDEVPLLSDDRLGRSLMAAFRAAGPQLALAVTRNVRAEFNLSLNELHNDSTTVSFYGAWLSLGNDHVVRRRTRPPDLFRWPTLPWALSQTE